MNRFALLLGLLCLLFPQTSLHAEPAASQPNRGPLWIGIKTAPASAALRAQLTLAKGRGIVVRSVTPNSPAAIAGLRVNDLLLLADRTPLSRPRDLVRVLNQVRNKQVAIEFLRAGRKQKVFVEPLPRREVAKPTTTDEAVIDRRFLRNLIDQIAPVSEAGAAQAPNAPRGQARIGEGLLSNLPDNFRITLRRDGGGPPRFVVENEGRRWELDGGNLDRWGQALLPLAEGLLGNDAPIAAPPELEVGQPQVTLPQAEITLPAVELPSELGPLKDAKQSPTEGSN